MVVWAIQLIISTTSMVL